MSSPNAEAGPSTQRVMRQSDDVSNPLILPALPSEFVASRKHLRKVRETRAPRRKRAKPQDGDLSPDTRCLEVRVEGEKTKRGTEHRKLVQERDLIVAHSPADANMPSDNLLRSIHLHATQYYTSCGLMPGGQHLSAAGSVSSAGTSAVNPLKGKRIRRRDMTEAIDGHGLVALGMIVQEFINHALAENGMRASDASRSALQTERASGLQPAVYDDFDNSGEDAEAEEGERYDPDVSDDNNDDD